MNVSLSKRALADLGDALRWYRKRSPSVAVQMVEEIEAAIDLLEHAPAIGTVRGRRGSEHIRAFPLARFPYLLWYVAQETRVLIVAFAHQRRKPGYWKKRF